MSTVTELLSSPDSVGVWNLAPARSTVAFKNKTMWGLMNVKGHFAEVRGDGQVTDTGAVSGRLDITAASLNTGIGKRDEHLRSPDFFDVEKFPEISVFVTAADPADADTFDLRADINIKGTSYPLPLRATVAVLDDGAVRVSVRTSLERAQFSVSGNMVGMVGGTTDLVADAVFQHTGAGSRPS
jgi:polyisoprenoid-binding protein YceI